MDPDRARTPRKGFPPALYPPILVPKAPAYVTHRVIVTRDSASLKRDEVDPDGRFLCAFMRAFEPKRQCMLSGGQ